MEKVNLVFIPDYQDSTKPFLPDRSPAEAKPLIRQAMPEIIKDITKTTRLEMRPSGQEYPMFEAEIDRPGHIKEIWIHAERGVAHPLPTSESEIEALIKFLTRVLEEMLPRL